MAPDAGEDDADDVIIGDDELTVLAMAADPDQPVDPAAVPFTTDATGPDLLPSWYMPATAARARGRTRRAVVAAFVIALIVVNGAGLCVTYGFPEIAW